MQITKRDGKIRPPTVLRLEFIGMGLKGGAFEWMGEVFGIVSKPQYVFRPALHTIIEDLPFSISIGFWRKGAVYLEKQTRPAFWHKKTWMVQRDS